MNQLQMIFNFTTPTLIYSYPYVEIYFVFFDNNISYISAQIDSQVQNTYTPFYEAQDSKFSFNVSCNSVQKKLKQAKFSFKYSISNSRIVLKLIPYQGGLPGSYFAIKEIKISTNCCVNCLVCQNSTECSQCAPGFNLVDFGSNISRCEQVNNCPANCTSCTIYLASLYCTSCKGGYTLNPTTNQCSANPTSSQVCLSSEYYNQAGQCESITTNCQLYDSFTQSYKGCTSSENPSQFRCPKDTFALVYYLNEVKFAKCGCIQKNCIKCNSTTNCIQCKSGYYLTSDGFCDKQCNTATNVDSTYDRINDRCCGKNCISCTKFQCLKCAQKNQYQDPNQPQLCVTTTDINCQTVDMYSGSCVQCKTNIVTVDNSECSCPIENCKQCNLTSDGGICTECQSSYYLTPSNQCCGVNNCFTCSYDNYNECSECSTDYVLDSFKKCILDCKVENCLTCVGDDPFQCSSCKANYKLDLNNQCYFDCQASNCQQCKLDQPFQCAICILNYKLNDSKNCIFDCQASNCSICISNDIHKCQTCNTNYKLDSNNNCIFDCQAQNCQTCMINNINQCSICYQNYKLDNNNNCVFDCQAENCSSCISNDILKCQTCNTNYKLDSNNNCILDCQVNNCQTCQSNDINQCSICNVNYKLNENKNCYFDCQALNCSICTSNDISKCKVCNTNYKLDENNNCIFDCQVQNCQACQLNNINQCSTCNQNYKLDNNNNCVFDCQVENCSTCIFNDIHRCQTCNTNYILNPNNSCIFDCQVQNCQTCQMNNINQCQICNSGYKLDANNNCIFDCQVDSCSSCVSNDITKCQICNTNYKLDQNNKCVLENCQIKNCQTCQLNNFNQCSVCNSNYKLDTDNNCILECQVDNCSICNLDNPSQCSICNNNYHIDINSKCILDCSVQNCSKCYSGNPDQCETCIQNYILDSNNTCILDCQVQNCQTCIENNLNKCQICNQNYQLDQNNNCQLVCQVSNCLQCNDQDPQICNQCQQNFKFDYKTKTCGCSIENCDACNQSQCEKCKPGYYLDSSKQLCQLYYIEGENDFFINQKLEIDNYYVKINFKKPIIMQTEQEITDYVQLIDINISNVNKTQYQYAITKTSQQEFQVKITPLSNMKNSEITVKILEKQFVEQNKLQKAEATEKLEPYAKISTQEREYSDKVTSTGKSVSSTAIYIIIPTLLMGNFYIICNTLDITGFLYYFPFLNIRLPYNVISFYGIFKDFSFPFIPNIFLGIISPDYQQPSPPKFMQFNTDNYFLSNAGQSFTVVLSGFGLYLLAKIFSHTRIIFIGPYCQRVVNETWEFGGLIDLAWSFYIYIIVGVLMQFNTINFDDENSAFINYSFHALCTLIYFGIPILLTALIYKNKNLKEDKDIQQKLSSVLSGLNLYNESKQQQNSFKKRKLLSKYYNMVLYLRKILFCALIVWFYDFVYAQLILFTLMNIGVIVFILMVNPFEQRIENIKNLVQELILIIIQICCAFLVEDRESELESNRINIGWIMVSLSGFIIAWYTFITLKDLLKGILLLFKRILLEFYSSLKRFFKNQKDLPLYSTYENPSMNKLRSLIMKRKQSLLIVNKLKESQFTSRKNSLHSSIFIQLNRVDQRECSPIIKGSEIKNSKTDEQEISNQV